MPQWSPERLRIERARKAALRWQQERDAAVARVVPASGVCCRYCYQPLRGGDGRYFDDRCRSRHEDLIGCW
jgi:hypothetical protein